MDKTGTTTDGVFQSMFTICEALVGGLCNKAFAHKQLPVGMRHPVALVTFYHADRDESKRGSGAACSVSPPGLRTCVMLPKVNANSSNATAAQTPDSNQAHTRTPKPSDRSAQADVLCNLVLAQLPVVQCSNQSVSDVFTSLSETAFATAVKAIYGPE